jgi:ABC-type dipeptide/oligopeptide/nickel transport system ATPase component
VEFPLTEIIGAVHEWFRVGAFRQGTTGEQDASSVYLEVIRTLGRRRKPAPMEPQTREELVHELENLNILTEPFIRHGLLSRYPFGELRDLLASTNRLKIPQIQSVLAPFLTSIRRRVDALNAVQTLISIYEEELNRYFRDKTATFHILEGLKISDRNAPLLPESLSSGERQLVFLMSAAILARAGKSLILIDEPELSLNYKWQRLIASSLARVASDSDTQFVLASHSIEIISRNLDSAVEL